jgi:signal transduction histidine kinase
MSGTGPEGRADQDRLLAGHLLLLAATRDLSSAADLPALSSIAEVAAGRLTGADTIRFALIPGEQGHYADPDQAADRPSGPEPAGQVSAVVVQVRSAHPIATLGAYWTRSHQVDEVEIDLLEALAESIAAGLDALRRRRQLERAAAASTAELAALTYAISHDLRAPIRHLEGFARILTQDATDLSPEARHGAQRIQDAAAHLREMVNGMLTLSRIGQSEVHPQSVDLAQLGREVAMALANAPTPAGGTDRAGVVEFVAPENLPVTGDPRLLLTALQDLLGNAWKFTSRIPRPRVELGVEPATGPEPVYFVRDNGAGFEPASAERLFGVFQRLHSGEDFPGTGVGLASVKRIVSKHGGQVRATGAPDSGATFFFTLPDGTTGTDAR